MSNQSSSNTDWTKFASLRVVALFAALVLIFYAVVLYVAIPSKKNVEFFGLKIKSQDTVIITKRDTLTRDSLVIVTKTLVTPCPPMVSQKNKNGENNAAGKDNKGIQGNNNNDNNIVEGNNYGHNGPTYSEIQLDDANKDHFLFEVYKTMREYGIKNSYVEYTVCSGSNLGKFADQAIQTLKDKGFDTNQITVVPFNPVRDYEVIPKKDSSGLFIVFGIH